MDDDESAAEQRAFEARMARPGPLQPRRPGDFDVMYTETPPWDIGRPQHVFVALADAGSFSGRVLDVGCGTGEHVLLAAERGFDATGIDTAASAIEIARKKAHDRGLIARFEVHDALDLPALGRPFDTVLDSGLFHVFEDDDRARFADSLHAAMEPDGRYHLLCFSDRQPGDWGPRRISQDDIHRCFRDGWRIDSIDAAEFETNLEPYRALAWHCTITRT